MVTEKIQELNALQAKAAKLQAAIETERTAELASLPERYGYDSVRSFIRAVRTASTAGTRRKRGPAKPKASSGKRKRAKITPELKEQVKSAVEAGKTGAAIAKEFGISLPSVQNIKKGFGLVKARG